jgi:DNA polymerase III sliding clamp (beta) subunit (PCNA family)
MKLKTSDLKQAFSHAHKVILKKPIIPVLSCFILSNKENINELHIKATDLNVYIDEVIKVDLDIQFEIAIPADEIMKFLSKVKSEFLEFHSKDGKLSVKSKEGKINIPLFKTDDYPKAPNDFMEFTSFEDKNEFIKLCQALPFTSEQDNNILNGINLLPEDGKLTLMATNQYTGGLSNIKCAHQNPAQVVMGGYYMKSIISILKSSDNEALELRVGGNYLMFQSGNIIVKARMLANSTKYPDIRRALPKNHSRSLAVNVKEMLSLLDTASIFIDEQKKCVDIVFKTDSIVISAENKMGSIECEALPAETLTDNSNGIEIKAKYNVQFLVTTLKAALNYSEAVTIYLAEDYVRRPTVIIPAGNLDYTCFATPMMV